MRMIFKPQANPEPYMRSGPRIGRMVDQPEPYCFLFALHQRCASSTPLQSRRWWMSSPPLTQHLGIKNDSEF